MNSSKIFDRSKEEIESVFDEFDVFYSRMEDFLKEKEVNEHELSVVKEIQTIIDSLDKGPKNMTTGSYDLGYSGWDGDSLTRADGRIATLMFNLGSIASQKVQKANVYGRWTKWKKFNAWNPAKESLEKQLTEAGKTPRVFKEDIEVEVGKKLFAENVIETMMAGHADLLTTMFDATRSVLTALAHRINFELGERKFSKGQK